VTHEKSEYDADVSKLPARKDEVGDGFRTWRTRVGLSRRLFASKFEPSSRISYLGVFLFDGGLADSESSKQSINIDRMIKSNEFASCYEKETGEGRAEIYEYEGRKLDRKKELAEVRVFRVMDDYFLCELLVNVDGSMGYYEKWLLVRSYEKTCYHRGKWKKMNIMEKIADLVDPFDVEKIIKQHKQYCILPTYSDPHPTPPGGK
jgi:hypothetical protein